jgi:hypothetical protein
VTDDDDLRATLPDPPPPAPKPRDAAIAAALARFDGAPALGPVPARAPRPASAPWWQKLHRPQAGLIAATALVVAISLPIMWQPSVPLIPTADEQQAAATQAPVPPARQDIAAAPAAIPTITPPQAETANPGIAPPASRPDEAAAPDRLMDTAQAPPAAPPPPAMRANESVTIVVQGRAASRPQQDTPVAVSVVSSEDYSDADASAGSIVVTGARQTASKPIGRGDWNACTVNDPRRAVTRCRNLAGTAAKTVRSQADTHLADGLQQAWNGNLDRATAAFDAAIAIAPELSVAYLNRGLVQDRQGNSDAAIADLDRAIRLAPKSARAYYNRSVLLRKYGDAKRADADEQQAINLDPRYQAILR